MRKSVLRGAVAGCSVVLIAFTVISAYAWSTLSRLFLPVSPVLSAFATLLPLLNLLYIYRISTQYSRKPSSLPPLPSTTATYLPAPSSSSSSSHSPPSHPSPRSSPLPPTTPIPGIPTTVLLILDTLLLTLSSTHLPRTPLTCALNTVWSRLFSAHDARAIAHIQDALECCGFATTRDRAFPFPGGKHQTPPDACVRDTGRTGACAPRLREVERTWVGVWVGVAAAMAVAKALAFLVAYYRAQHHQPPRHSRQQLQQQYDDFRYSTLGRIRDVADEEAAPATTTTNGRDATNGAGRDGGDRDRESASGREANERTRLLPAAQSAEFIWGQGVGGEGRGGEGRGGEDARAEAAEGWEREREE